MIKSAAWFMLCSFVFLGALTLTEYYAFALSFNWSKVISLFSLFGYAVLMFFLWYSTRGLLVRKPRSPFTWLLIALCIFFTWFAFFLDNQVMPTVLLGGAAGWFTDMQRRRSALLCGLVSTGLFAYLMAGGFWQGEFRTGIIFTLILMGCAVYFKLTRKLKNENL